jgi:hypothetical protein
MASISDSTTSASFAPAQGTERAHRSHGGKHAKQAFANAAKELGLSDQQTADLQTQIDDALKSSGTKDPKQFKAIADKVLKKNGVDAEKFDQAIKAQFEQQRAARKGQRPVNDHDADDGARSVKTPTGGIDTIG